MELLLIVVIVAVLTIIALPNLGDFRERRNAIQIKKDLRAYAIALDAYHTDYGTYPILDALSYNAMVALTPLSTPIAYLATSNLEDPFQSTHWMKWMAPPLDKHYLWAYYRWTGEGKRAVPPRTYGDYLMFPISLDLACVWSLGPSRPTYNNGPILGINQSQGRPQVQYGTIYDPTNGTNSMGIIARYVGETYDLPSPK